MSDELPRTDDPTQLPGPARFTRETLIGCVGLLCVLLTVPLLWIAVGLGRGWLNHALPLLAFAAAIGGAALTLRVPSGLITRSNDPRRPLTSSGDAPTIEQPATTANHLTAALSTILALVAAVGICFELAQPGKPWGLAFMLASGAALLILGLLVYSDRAPAPAWRWVRRSIYGAAFRTSGPLIAGGLFSLCGGLFRGMLDGYSWGVLGLATVVVIGMLLTPLARRMPPQPRRARPVNRHTPWSS